jgi:asparagine synthase (glutamine-hydrolysing)
VTRDAARAVAGLLREAARQAREPGGPALAAEPGAHRDLAAVHAVAREARGFQHLAARQGALLSAPFLDDRVLAAALSVEVTARHAPRGGRPLLAAAMRDVLPGPLPDGRTAPDTAAAAPGGRADRERLAALAEDSRLARMGLVDADALRAALLGPADAAAPPARIEPAVACELWLRAAGGAHRAHVGG